MAGDVWLDGTSLKAGSRALPRAGQRVGLPEVLVALALVFPSLAWVSVPAFGNRVYFPNGTCSHSSMALCLPFLVPLEFVPFALELFSSLVLLVKERAVDRTQCTRGGALSFERQSIIKTSPNFWGERGPDSFELHLWVKHFASLSFFSF